MTRSATSRGQARRLANQSVSILAASALANVGLFAVNLLVVRHYGEDTHNRISVVLAIGTVLVITSTLGLIERGTIRRLAESKTDSGRLGELLATTVTGIAVLTALTVAGLLIGGNAIERLARLDGIVPHLAVWTVGRAASRTALLLAIVFERNRLFVAVSVIPLAGMVMGSVVAVSYNLELSQLLMSWTIAWLVGLVVSLAVISHTVRTQQQRLRLNQARLSASSRLIRVTLVDFVPSLAVLGLAPIVILATRLFAPDNVSMVQVALALSLAGSLVAQAVSTALFRTAAETWSTDYKAGVPSASTPDRSSYLGRAIKAVGFLVIAGWLATWFLGERVLVGFYGDDYGAARNLLLAFVFAVFLDGISSQLDQIAILGNQTVGVISAELGKFITFVAVFALAFAPSDAHAAGIALMCGSAFAFAFKTLLVRRHGLAPTRSALSVVVTGSAIVGSTWLSGSGLVGLLGLLGAGAWFVRRSASRTER